MWAKKLSGIIVDLEMMDQLAVADIKMSRGDGERQNV